MTSAMECDQEVDLRKLVEKRARDETASEKIDLPCSAPKRANLVLNGEVVEKNYRALKYECLAVGCELRFRHPSGRAKHMKSHLPKPQRETWPHICEEKDCSKRFQTAPELRQHQAVHLPNTIACTFSGCSKMFPTVARMRNHLTKTHLNRRVFKCTHSGCAAAFKNSDSLKKHGMVHCDERPFECKEADCDAAFKSEPELLQHGMVHTDDRPFKCIEVGCSATYKGRPSLRTHMMTHRGERPYKCIHQQYSCPYPRCGALATFGFEEDFKLHVEIAHQHHPLKAAFLKSGGIDCDYASTLPGNVRRHVRDNHEHPRSRRDIKREIRLRNAFQEAGLRYENNVHVNFSCFPTEGHRASVDFQVHGREDGALVIVEVDQFQHNSHKYYTQACERRRLLDIITAVQCNPFTQGLRVLFIRYNPDPYKVDGKKLKKSNKEREAKLVDVIKSMPLPDDGRLLTLLYMFYDSVTVNAVTEEKQACVLVEDEEAPQMLCDCAVPAIV